MPKNANRGYAKFAEAVKVNPNGSHSGSTQARDFVALFGSIARTLEEDWQYSRDEIPNEIMNMLRGACSRCGYGLNGGQIVSIALAQSPGPSQVGDAMLLPLVKGNCPDCDANNFQISWLGLVPQTSTKRTTSEKTSGRVTTALKNFFLKPKQSSHTDPDGPKGDKGAGASKYVQLDEKQISDLVGSVDFGNRMLDVLVYFEYDDFLRPNSTVLLPDGRLKLSSKLPDSTKFEVHLSAQQYRSELATGRIKIEDPRKRWLMPEGIADGEWDLGDRTCVCRMSNVSNWPGSRLVLLFNWDRQEFHNAMVEKHGYFRGEWEAFLAENEGGNEANGEWIQSFSVANTIDRIIASQTERNRRCYAHVGNAFGSSDDVDLVTELAGLTAIAGRFSVNLPNETIHVFK